MHIGRRTVAARSDHAEIINREVNEPGQETKTIQHRCGLHSFGIGRQGQHKGRKKGEAGNPVRNVRVEYEGVEEVHGI